MKKVIQFMRHEFTDAQNQAITELFGDVEKIDMREQASRSLQSNEDVAEIMADFQSAIGPWQERNRLVIVGMVPTPLMWDIVESGLECEVWQAWNTSRPVEGGRPVFEFKKWVCVHSQKMTAEAFLIEFFGADSVEVENETKIHITFKGYREGLQSNESCTLDSNEMDPANVAKTLLTTGDEPTNMSWVDRLGEEG